MCLLSLKQKKLNTLSTIGMLWEKIRSINYTITTCNFVAIHYICKQLLTSTVHEAHNIHNILLVLLLRPTGTDNNLRLVQGEMVEQGTVIMS